MCTTQAWRLETADTGAYLLPTLTFPDQQCLANNLFYHQIQTKKRNLVKAEGVEPQMFQ